MKASKFTPEQIIGILRESDAGAKTPDQQTRPAHSRALFDPKESDRRSRSLLYRIF